jgi:transcription elongation GreA/GreB family factor
LRRERPKDERLEELTRILSSVTVVEPLTEASKVIAFGAVVTVEAAHGSTETFRIVGVDEVTLWPNAVSWISPTGKTLLAAELGDRATIDGNDAAPVRIVKVEYDALES